MLALVLFLYGEVGGGKGAEQACCFCRLVYAQEKGLYDLLSKIMHTHDD